MRKPYRFRRLRSKVIAAFVVLACAVIGFVGIVLPVIPGLLFLALAALIVARNVPWVDARLRAHRSFGPHMHRLDRFSRLGFVDQLRVAALMTVKCTLDALDRAVDWLSRRGDGSRVRST